jgi:hypothetical protein
LVVADARRHAIVAIGEALRRALAFLILGLYGTGCLTSAVVCNCPNGGAQLRLPTPLPSRIVDVKADTCTAQADETAGVISLSASKATICHVRVDLADGRTLAATVDFRSLGSCCADVYWGADASALAPVDGGRGP